MKPLKKFEPPKYPTKKNLFHAGIAIFITSCGSPQTPVPHHHTNENLNFPNIQSTSQFDCPSLDELQKFQDEEFKRRMEARQKDKPMIRGDVDRLTGSSFNFPVTDFIPVTLKDGMKTAYSLKIEFGNEKDGDRIRENIGAVSQIITDEIVLFVKDSSELPRIQFPELRDKIAEKLAEKLRLENWVSIEIISACDLYAFLR
jgi:hypothetical protein